MPKDKNNGREMTPDEKFRSFFSTTAVDIPEEMTRRDENQPEEKPQKRFGLFGRGKEKQETDEAAAEQPQEMPTGEVRLGEDAQPEPEADLELMLKPEADPEQELAPWPFLEKEAEDAQPEAPAKKPEEKSAPQTADPPAAVKPETPRQSAVPAARPAEQHSTAKPLRHPKNAPEVLLPQEEQEQQEMKKPVQLWGLSLLGVILQSLSNVLCAVPPILGMGVSSTLSAGMENVFLDAYHQKEINSKQIFSGFSSGKSFLRIAGGIRNRW